MGRRASSSGSSSGKTGSSSRGKSGTSSSGAKGVSTPSKSTSISSGGTVRTITTYRNGGGRLTTIPSGQLFAGGTQSGAARPQVWGNRGYGSGYPGLYSRGISDRVFPFYFWPVVWLAVVNDTSNTAYLHSEEYGRPDNASRPGGAMATAAFQPNSTGTTFRLIADNTTVAYLMPAIAANCSSFLMQSSIPATTPTPFNASAVAGEQVVRYYHASSVALSLDGYNNTAVFIAENTTSDTPLPTGIDKNLLDCLNATAVPLVDGAYSTLSASSFGVLAVVLLLHAVE
ncbi:hypothetical protein DFH09DRAFT_1307776 [Mycena vulgaris]|nr:hypothetical protein DFH09DRAFT_1307776 [Mycena vulgaris]